MKILFVCSGNTCRSPMAEGLFRKISEEGRETLTLLKALWKEFSGNVDAVLKSIPEKADLENEEECV